MKRVAVSTLVAMALLASSCADSDGPSFSELVGSATSSSPPSPTIEPAPQPTAAGGSVDLDPGFGGSSQAAEIERVECPPDLDDEAITCGLATVPLDPNAPNGPTTVISFATMVGSDAGFDTPVAVLQGGPGGASSEMASWFPQQAFAQVFIDQRGTGFGPVELDCPEGDEIVSEILALGSDEALELEFEAYWTCAQRLKRDPVLLSTNTAAMAADVAAVMAGLGGRRWVVYGVSYGSTIALELMRMSADGMVGAVLDGVYPPDIDTDVEIAFSAQRSIDAVDQACSADPDCTAIIDGVSDTLDRLIVELDENPIVVPASRGAPKTVIDGDRLAVFTFLLLYGENEIAYIPWMLSGLDQRDPDAARWAAAVGNAIMESSTEFGDEGTYFAVHCADRAPFTSGPPSDAGVFPAVIADPTTSDICEMWDMAESPAWVGSPVESDIPALLLSGGFDPITPAKHARAAAEHLSNSTVVEQAGRGHGIWFGNRCIADIVLSFVSDPTRTLDTSCADEPVPVDWVQR